MKKAKKEASDTVNSREKQSMMENVPSGSSPTTARPSIHSLERSIGDSTSALSPLSACILRLAELGRQRLAREAQAMSENVGDELPVDTHEDLD